MIKRIVVGFDGSQESRHAVGWAADLAHLTQARLDIVAVAQPPEIAADVETEDLLERMQAHYRLMLNEMESSLTLKEDQVSTQVLVGHPAEQLLRFAQEHAANHLVVGHRSRTALRKWLSGSVARHLIDHATCAVSIVR